LKRKNNITMGISFENLPATYCCPWYEASKDEFKKIEKSSLGLQAI
jgi:rubredoxin